MKKLLLTLGFLVAANLLFCQETDPERIFIEMPQPANLELADGIEAEGTPYLDTTFVKGEFKMKTTSYLAPMRYNIYLDLFEVNQGSSIVCINSNNVEEISLNNSTFVYLKEGKSKKGFEILSEKGNSTFLKKHKVSYFEGKMNKKGKMKVYPRYKSEKPFYYFRSAEGAMTAITKMDDLKALVPNKSEEITAFVKQNKLKKKKEADWVTLFNYIAELK